MIILFNQTDLVIVESVEMFFFEVIPFPNTHFKDKVNVS